MNQELRSKYQFEGLHSAKKKADKEAKYEEDNNLILLVYSQK